MHRIMKTQDVHLKLYPITSQYYLSYIPSPKMTIQIDLIYSYHQNRSPISRLLKIAKYETCRLMSAQFFSNPYPQPKTCNQKLPKGWPNFLKLNNIHQNTSIIQTTRYTIKHENNFVLPTILDTGPRHLI